MERIRVTKTRLSPSEWWMNLKSCHDPSATSRRMRGSPVGMTAVNARLRVNGMRARIHARQDARIEEESIRLRSLGAPEDGAEEKARVTPLGMTCGLLVAGDCFV
jgi:hypothetical protein